MSQYSTFRAKRIRNVGTDTMFEIRGGQHYMLPTSLVTYENHNKSVYGYVTIPNHIVDAKKILTTRSTESVGE